MITMLGTKLGTKTKHLLLMLGLSVALDSGLVLAQAPQPTPMEAAEKLAEVQQIDINKADAATLADALVGVGASKAKAIIAYRENNGPFTSIDQLMNVNGIGQAILNTNRHRLTLGNTKKE